MLNRVPQTRNCIACHTRALADEGIKFHRSILVGDIRLTLPIGSSKIISWSRMGR